MTRRARMRRRTLGLIAVAAIAAVLLLALGVFLLRLPSAVETVTVVQWTIQQGTTSQGKGWFGPSEFNFTEAKGFPMTVAPGGQVTVDWSFQNNDSVSHTIYAVCAGAPFGVPGTSPPLPTLVLAGADNAALEVTVPAPSDAGASLVLDLTVYAVSPPPRC